MPTDFVSDYEALTGETVEDATKRLAHIVETKVIAAPVPVKVAPVKVAEVK